MKYFTAIEWVLNHDDFLEVSKEASRKEVIYTNKTKKKISEKVRWGIVNNLIKKKMKHHGDVQGICTCTAGILCEHRKKYLTRLLNGKNINW